MNKSSETEQRIEVLRLAKAKLIEGLEILDASNLSIAANQVSASIDSIEDEIERLKKS